MANDHGFRSPLSRFQRRFGFLCVLIGLVGLVEFGNGLAQPAAEVTAASPSASAVWTLTGKLNAARFSHTATLLPNGKVLVAGGARKYNDTLDSAELYDPDSGTWSLTGPMTLPRISHTATLLANGKVLVTGGETGAGFFDDAAELYDPATGTWTPTGKMNGARVSHSATLLQNGKVLVAGGWGSDLGQSAELYDPETGTWRVTGRLKADRYEHAATILEDGSVLVVGGLGDGALVLESAELYDPNYEMWRRTDGLKFAAIDTTATRLRDGTVLVAGGWGYLGGSGYLYPGVAGVHEGRNLTSVRVAQVYDPATATWGDPINVRVARESHTATLLPSGDVLLAGGTTGRLVSTYVGETLNQTELYSPASGATIDGPSLRTARVGHTATLLPNGTVLVAGGGSDVAELYRKAPLSGTIVAGTTGSWYNPAQGGQGFMLEVLQGAPMQLLASWFVFAPQGGPAWIVGLGPVNGNQAAVQGMQAAGPGGRFPPNFDAANVHDTPWGTLTFTFSDCNHGHVEWASTVPGYSSGEMDLARLTLPAGLSCVD